MEQYSESFRTVEGIHDLMMLSATRPKSRVMATYYEQLSKVFLVSKNYLFHSYAAYKYFLLYRDHNKSMTEAQVRVREERSHERKDALVYGLL